MNDCKVEHIIIDALAYSRQPLAPSVLDAARAELRARKQPRPHYVWAYAVVAVVVVVLCLSTALPLTLSTPPSTPGSTAENQVQYATMQECLDAYGIDITTFSEGSEQWASIYGDDNPIYQRTETWFEKDGDNLLYVREHYLVTGNIPRTWVGNVELDFYIYFDLHYYDTVPNLYRDQFCHQVNWEYDEGGYKFIYNYYEGDGVGYAYALLDNYILEIVVTCPDVATVYNQLRYFVRYQQLCKKELDKASILNNI